MYGSTIIKLKLLKYKIMSAKTRMPRVRLETVPTDVLVTRSDEVTNKWFLKYTRQPSRFMREILREEKDLSFMY